MPAIRWRSAYGHALRLPTRCSGLEIVAVARSPLYLGDLEAQQAPDSIGQEPLQIDSLVGGLLGHRLLGSHFLDTEPIFLEESYFALCLSPGTASIPDHEVVKKVRKFVRTVKEPFR